jgi:hypothetical protein
MLNPFQAHALGFQQYTAALGNGDSMSQGLLLIGSIKIPCTHTQLVRDFELVPGGKSVSNFVERCEFLQSICGNYIPSKGDKVSLRVNYGSAQVQMMFWHGGPMEGGLIYRFMLVAANYKS